MYRADRYRIRCGKSPERTRRDAGAHPDQLLGHYIWLALLYGIAGAYSGRNPLNVIRNYGPAYMTAVGTMSSAATLSVALECAKKSEPTLRDDLVSFGIPLFANIHLCGSVMTETYFVMAVSKMLYGALTLFLTGYAEKHGIKEANLGDVLG